MALFVYFVSKVITSVEKLDDKEVNSDLRSLQI